MLRRDAMIHVKKDILSTLGVFMSSLRIMSTLHRNDEYIRVPSAYQRIPYLCGGISWVY